MTNFRNGITLFLSSLLIFSCADQANTIKEKVALLEAIPMQYAKAFEVFRTEDGLLIKSHIPHQTDLLQEISITFNHENETETGNRITKIPGRIVVISTTYLGYLKSLNELTSIAGISNSELVCDSTIRQMIEDGVIADVGNDQSLNYERIIDLNPDIIFFYDFGPSTAAVVKKLERLGLTVVRVNEFREVSPLGKAEWIKFFGAIYGKMDMADSLFAVIESKYNALLELGKGLKKRPTVFTGLPWKGEWYQPGGKSFQARYFKDAGANYLWEEDENVSGINVDIEVVIDKALKADFWLHPSNTLSTEEIRAQDDRYAHFASLQKGRVFNNNLRVNPSMGNDYWESGLMNPHLILEDLLAIFHPELLPEHHFYYYRQLE